MSVTSRAGIVRPRSVQPYFRVVEVSACSKGEKHRLFFDRNADADVAHTEPEHDFSPAGELGGGLLSHLHNHLAELGELDRVADEVQEHLEQPADQAVSEYTTERATV
jgi:hypothetical protein